MNDPFADVGWTPLLVRCVLRGWAGKSAERGRVAAQWLANYGGVESGTRGGGVGKSRYTIWRWKREIACVLREALEAEEQLGHKMADMVKYEHR